MTPVGNAASVRQRLLNLAHASGEDYHSILIRYAGLRFLARLAASTHAEHFVLKGATMFLVWHESLHRPTRDIDLLGFLEPDEARLTSLVQAVCGQEVEEDGLRFEPATVRVERIREATAYGGLRCLIEATIGTAKLRVQVDVGFGDDVTPQPERVEIPRLLDNEVRRELRAYTVETVVAEKLEAIVKLGLANSRMKDYFDLDHLVRSGKVDRQTLSTALERTFRRRKTPLPSTLPLGLSEAFWSDGTAQRRWQAFRGKHRLPARSLHEICETVGAEMLEALALVDAKRT